MKLKPGFEAEYKKRHDAVWIELEQEFKEQGIFKYLIFLDEETHTLFAFQEIESNKIMNIQNMDLYQKWWDYMADIMEVHPDNKPIVIPLKGMYNMKRPS